MQGLNRQEIEDYVIDLYHNQNKTFREIQKIVRKSPRDIRAILDKVEPERTSLSESSRAYRMFKEGSNPTDVAIALNLRENQVNELYREYWNLNGLYHLNQIYSEIKDDIWTIIELHRRTKTEGLSPQQVSRILKVNITLEHKNRDLECEQVRLEVSNKHAAQTFQQLTDLIQKDHRTLEANEYAINQQKREIENLNTKKTRLENIIDSIQSNNEVYVKIIEMVKQEIESIISNPRRLLQFALACIFESSRMHPGRLHAMYYNMPTISTIKRSSSSILIGDIQDNQREQYLYHYTSDYATSEKMLLDEAEQLYNRLIEESMSACTISETNDTDSSIHSLKPPELPDICTGHAGKEDSDANENDLLTVTYETLD